MYFGYGELVILGGVGPGGATKTVTTTSDGVTFQVVPWFFINNITIQLIDSSYPSNILESPRFALAPSKVNQPCPKR